MQVTVQLEAGTLPPMVKPYRPGVEARDVILRELRRREDARPKLPPPSLSDLAALLGGVEESTVSRHLSTLRKAGAVERDPQRYRSWRLTDAGRIATDTPLTKRKDSDTISNN